MEKIEKLGYYEKGNKKYSIKHSGGGKSTFVVRVCEKGSDPHYSPLWAIVKKLDELIDAVNELQGEEKPEEDFLKKCVDVAYNYAKITNQELDKAREEGYIKGVKECTEKLSKLKE